MPYYLNIIAIFVFFCWVVFKGHIKQSAKGSECMAIVPYKGNSSTSTSSVAMNNMGGPQETGFTLQFTSGPFRLDKFHYEGH